MYVCYWLETEVYSSIFTAAKLPLANGSKWDKAELRIAKMSVAKRTLLSVNHAINLRGVLH